MEAGAAHAEEHEKEKKFVTIALVVLAVAAIFMVIFTASTYKPMEKPMIEGELGKIYELLNFDYHTLGLRLFNLPN